MFTHRSSRATITASDLREQLKLLGLYAFGLVSGAIVLFVLRRFCLELLHRNTPEAAAMIGRFAAAMVFTGLLQALGTWALASRWIKISLLYGALGIGYWLALLFLGKSPAALLQMMPVAAGHRIRRAFSGLDRRHAPAQNRRAGAKLIGICRAVSHNCLMPSGSENLPRVSFIMPTLNVEALLDNCLVVHRAAKLSARPL